MGTILSNNDRVRLCSTNNLEDIGNLTKTSKTDSSKTILIENKTELGKKKYNFYSSVPVEDIRKFLDFLKGIEETDEDKSREKGLTAYKKDSSSQNRECPICQNSSLPGWVILFDSNPAFYIHDDCISKMLKIESDLEDSADDFIHDLI
jgi:hypothetical protein